MSYPTPDYKNYNWKAISGNAYTSWARSSNCSVNTTTGIITMTPAALDWTTTLTSNNCNYTWANVKNGKKFHIKFDYTITNGIATDGADLAVSVQFVTAQNPTSTTGRTGYVAFGVNATSASGTFEKYGNIETTSGSTPVDTNYLAIKIWAYTGAGSTVTLKNIIAEVN